MKMLLRRRLARVYWKGFVYVLLACVIIFYILKNDQNLVKNHSKTAIKTVSDLKKNYHRVTVTDVKPKPGSIRLLNLTNIKISEKRQNVYTTMSRNVTTRSLSEIELFDKSIADYFSDKNYSPPILQPEVRHIAFLKVHKAASSTMQNMFFRFGRKRNLTFVFTKHPNYFSRSSKTHISLIPPKVTTGYDILCNHGVFNFSIYSSVLPNDTLYIGIVRDPLSVFISAVNFYSQESQKLGYLVKIKGQKLQKLIHRPEVYDRNFFSYTKNVMSRDFGFPETFNSSIIFQTLKDLDQIFKLVLIVEHFEESLVLMRRYLNWKLQDILFLPNNVFTRRVKTGQFSHQYHGNMAFNHARAIPWYRKAGTFPGHHRDKTVSKSELNARDIEQFKIRNKLDYYLYSFFYQKFWKQFKNVPGNIGQEVTHFKQVLEKLNVFCNHTEMEENRKPLLIPKSEWSEEFTVTVEDCVFMKMDELTFIKILRRKQGSELTEVQNGWYPHRLGRYTLDELRRMNKLQLRRNQLRMKMENKQKVLDNSEIAERGLQFRRIGLNQRAPASKDT